ncbi:MAG: hypothetical protein ACRDID_07315 [Ktedonobacterales bacterium]
MSSMQCWCGHIISDRTDNLPYKARLGPDEEPFAPASKVAEEIAHYVEAREHNRQVEYLFEHVFQPVYDEHYLNLAQSEAERFAREPLSRAFTLLLSHSWGGVGGRLVYECEECGRLWVESGDHYVSYAPETDTRHVLRSRYFGDGGDNPIG